MSYEDQDERRGGGLPNSWRNAVVWRWARELPRPLCGGVLTMLYVVGAAADASGRLRFAGDHRPIRISDLAAAARCDVKDARRYLAAMVAAGVLVVEGETGPGKRPLYTLVLTPSPDWDAAAASLAASTRTRKPRKTPPPWESDTTDTTAGPATDTTDTAADFGGQTPEVTSGGSPPNSGPEPGTDFGGQTPFGLRGADPRRLRGAVPPTTQGNPGGSQEIADVGEQVPVRAREDHNDLSSSSSPRDPDRPQHDPKTEKLLAGIRGRPGARRATRRHALRQDRDPLDTTAWPTCACGTALDPDGLCPNPTCPGHAQHAL